MKKFLIVTMALVLVLGLSVTALAAGAESRQEARGKLAGEQRERLTEEQREIIQAKRIGLFETYYQDGVEDFLALQDEHKEFHIGAQADREELKEAIKSSFVAIKAAVENGDISKRDGRVEFIELKIKIRTMRNEMDLVRLDKIADQAAGNDRMMEIREEVKTLLAAEPVDSDAVALLLAESLELLRAHIDSDIYYHGLMLGIAEAYGF